MKLIKIMILMIDNVVLLILMLMMMTMTMMMTMITMRFMMFITLKIILNNKLYINLYIHGIHLKNKKNINKGILKMFL